MSQLEKLIQMADSPKFRNRAPQRFIKAMGLMNSSEKFCKHAWELFKMKRRRLTLLEVQQYSLGREEELRVGCIKSHFFDSGAFTLWTRAAVYAKEHGCGRWDFYDTPEHWQYLDDYAAFVKTHSDAIDHYANVDVIPNPELTWRNQQYLENKHGLRPVPCVHYRDKDNLKWLRHYIDKGYDFIALGGLVGSTSQDECKRWIDSCFSLICPGPSYLPIVKIHGFGVTQYELLLRYPWYSVDSTSWTKVGAFGGIIVPQRRTRNGKLEFVFDRTPRIIKMSADSPQKKLEGAHYHSLRPLEQQVIQDWLKEIGVPLGRAGDDGRILERGVITFHTYRRSANLMFFERMRAEAVPEYPWAFRSKRRPKLKTD